MWPYFQLGQYTFYTFGLAIGVGIVCSCFALQAYIRSHELAVNLPLFAGFAIPFGFVCARLDSIMFERAPNRSWAEFAHHLMYGGLTYFGGFMGATVAFMLLMRLYRLPWLRTLDAMFCVGLAYAIGRIGCFLAGDGDYGRVSTLPWAMSFPHGLVPTLQRVHPSMLYIAAWELLIFLILWRMSVSGKHWWPGMLLGLYLIGTSVGRFFIEFLSRNRTLGFGMTEAQLVSVVLFSAGTTLIAFVSMREVEALRSGFSGCTETNDTNPGNLVK